MRRICYSVAMSLDGFIAGPNGEFDWITVDPSFDFAAHYRGFDTVLMGRVSYELALTQGQYLKAMGMKVAVISTTLKPEKHPGVAIVATGVAKTVAALKAEPGKDIWLFGGARLFRSLLDLGLVDAVEVAVVPVLLGDGLKLIPEGSRCRLHLDECKTLPNGTVMLKYSIEQKPIDG
jgi:dihydrofolate reductase